MRPTSVGRCLPWLQEMRLPASTECAPGRYGARVSHEQQCFADEQHARRDVHTVGRHASGRGYRAAGLWWTEPSGPSLLTRVPREVVEEARTTARRSAILRLFRREADKDAAPRPLRPVRP